LARQPIFGRPTQKRIHTLRADAPDKMPPRKRVGLQQIMDAAQAPAPKKDAPASVSDANCEAIAVAAQAPPAGEPSTSKATRGTAGRTKYQQNQARRKELKAEAVADCDSRGVGGAENISMAWFQRLEAASLLTPSQKTLFNSLRANEKHSATADGTREETRITPLQSVQHHVDAVRKMELDTARAQLEALNITAPLQDTVVPKPSGGAEERAQIKSELKEIRALLAADAARRKKKEAVVVAKTAAAAATPPPKPAAEARIWQMPSFSSTSTW
jgi:hypothetical protein